MIIKDTVLGIEALAQFACLRSPSTHQNLNVTVMSNQTIYSFEPITKDNNELLQKAEVSYKSKHNSIQHKCYFYNQYTVKICEDGKIRW